MRKYTAWYTLGIHKNPAISTLTAICIPSIPKKQYGGNEEYMYRKTGIKGIFGIKQDEMEG